jgi:hypothetical protein
MEVPPPLEATPSTRMRGSMPVLVTVSFVNHTSLPVASKSVPVIVTWFVMSFQTALVIVGLEADLMP